MKEYIFKTMIYLATIATIGSYGLSGTESAYAAANKSKKQNTFLLDYRNGILNIGYNGKIRNINHDISGAKRELDRKKFELQNKLRQRDPVVKIRVGKRVIRF